MNILISVVTDNYDNVVQRILAIDYQRKALLLLANERLLFWKRHSGSKKFIFLAKYTTMSQLDDKDQIDGKFRQIKTQINDITFDLKYKLKRSCKLIKNELNAA